MQDTGAGALPSSLRRALPSAALAAALLGGCAGWQPPEPPRAAPTVVTPQRIEGLVALLDAEWRRWGERIVSLDGPDGACLAQPDGRCVEVADGCGDEQSAALCPRINAYWRAVPPFVDRQRCERTDVCTTDWPAEEPRGPRSAPWSAAFVSAVMRRAGFTPSEFRPSQAHVGYVVAARDGDTSAYAVLPTPAVAAPGDLICAMRGASSITPRELARLGDGPLASAMHCDVVVAVDASRGVLEAIGGNVQQTVAKTIVGLDAQGRVSFVANPNRRWVLVMRARRALPEPLLP